VLSALQARSHPDGQEPPAQPRVRNDVSSGAKSPNDGDDLQGLLSDAGITLHPHRARDGDGDHRRWPRQPGEQFQPAPSDTPSMRPRMAVRRLGDGRWGSRGPHQPGNSLPPIPRTPGLSQRCSVWVVGSLTGGSLIQGCNQALHEGGTRPCSVRVLRWLVGARRRGPRGPSQGPGNVRDCPSSGAAAAAPSAAMQV
jgi:hypothetical protein